MSRHVDAVRQDPDEVARSGMVEAHRAADQHRGRATTAVAQDLVPLAGMLELEPDDVRRRDAGLASQHVSVAVRVVDFSAAFGHAVPTIVAFHRLLGVEPDAVPVPGRRRVRRTWQRAHRSHRPGRRRDAGRDGADPGDGVRVSAPHHRVFISNIGFGGAPGDGEILAARVR
jgi:hypothetical protein